MLSSEKPKFLLDSSPLSVLCGFPHNRLPPYIYRILPLAEIVLADGVVKEAGMGKIARTIQPLIRTGAIITVPSPTAPTILESAYAKLLGIGEISTIKVALATQLPLILDDKDAFIVACRFGLRPIGFQDFIVQLVREYGVLKPIGTEIVQVTSQQFPNAFLAHTLDLLS